jgi:hypothetical protein
MDFVRALLAQSPASQHALIRQLLLEHDSSWIWQQDTANPH